MRLKKEGVSGDAEFADALEEGGDKQIEARGESGKGFGGEGGVEELPLDVVDTYRRGELAVHADVTDCGRSAGIGDRGVHALGAVGLGSVLIVEGEVDFKT